MKKHFIVFLIASCLSSCVSDQLKNEMGKAMEAGQQVMADATFKQTLANVEMHKLRTGSYPNTLSEIKYRSAMDSTMSQNVEYKKLDTGYELNTKLMMPALNGEAAKYVELHYPKEFWQGLGCVKSNAK